MFPLLYTNLRQIKMTRVKENYTFCKFVNVRIPFLESQTTSSGENSGERRSKRIKYVKYFLNVNVYASDPLNSLF